MCLKYFFNYVLFCIYSFKYACYRLFIIISSLHHMLLFIHLFILVPLILCRIYLFIFVPLTVLLCIYSFKYGCYCLLIFIPSFNHVLLLIYTCSFNYVF